MVVKTFCANETATRDDLIARANSNTLRKQPISTGQTRTNKKGMRDHNIVHITHKVSTTTFIINSSD
jgi:hypothetical protein